MKTRLLTLAVAVLGAPLLAHAGNLPNPNDAPCHSVVIATISALLWTLFGIGPIC